MGDITIGIILVILAAIFWGVANAIARVGLQSIKATSGTILSLATGLIVALIIALVFEFDDLVSVSLVAVGLFAVTGLFHFALGRLFLYQSMRYVGAARGTSIGNSSPIFALILAVMFLQETPTVLVVIGTLAVVGGLYSLLSESSESRVIKKSRILGYCFGLATALCWGVAQVLIRQSSQLGPPFVVLSFALLSGILALSITTGKDFEIGIKTNKKAISLLLVAGFLNGIGLASFYSSLAMAPVVVISPLSATSPLFTVLCAHLFLGRLERITPHVLIGCFLVVIGGILVATY